MIPLQLASKGANGSAYKITLTKTGATSAVLELKTWSAGSDLTGGPDGGDDYSLGNIVLHGDTMSCTTKVMFMDISVAISLTTAPPTVIVDVRALGDHQMKFPISGSDHAKAEAFLKTFKQAPK